MKAYDEMDRRDWTSTIRDAELGKWLSDDNMKDIREISKTLNAGDKVTWNRDLLIKAKAAEVALKASVMQERSKCECLRSWRRKGARGPRTRT